MVALRSHSTSLDCCCTHSWHKRVGDCCPAPDGPASPPSPSPPPLAHCSHPTPMQGRQYTHARRHTPCVTHSLLADRGDRRAHLAVRLESELCTWKCARAGSRG